MSDTVIASDGTQLPLDEIPNAFTYDGNNNVLTITVNYTSAETRMPRNFVQTFTYSGNNVATISGWVAQ
jgi:hypothetical protein